MRNKFIKRNWSNTTQAEKDAWQLTEPSAKDIKKAERLGQRLKQRAMNMPLGWATGEFEFHLRQQP